MKFLRNIEDRLKPTYLVVLVGSGLNGILGVVDYLTGYDMGFSLFYVLPVALVTWLAGRRLGVMTSVISAGIWYWADAAGGHQYSNALTPIWNTLIRLAFFLIITFLLAALQHALQREEELARVDGLTGAVNARFFYTLADREMDRCRRYRHPFTLAYVDLDDFKLVNDQRGHHAGDEVLRRVVASAREHLRKTDVVARLGGDEFGLLCPETNEEAAKVVVSKVRDGLLEEMRLGNWPITFSIGVMTCRAVPDTSDELLRMADEIMYTVKRDGKNGIRYSTYAGHP